MDPPLQKIAIGGAVLASIMQDFGSSAGDCDGVLFGRVDKIVSQNLQDDDDQPPIREELTALVTGYFCSGGLMSFYDATGRIDFGKFAQLSGGREQRNGDSPIGWFVGRRNTPMRPSMRESAVTRYLRMGSSFPTSSSDSKIQAGSGQKTRENRIPVDVHRLSPHGSGSVLREVVGSPQIADSRTGFATEIGFPRADPVAKVVPRSPSRIDKSSVSVSRASPSRDAVHMKFGGIPPSSPCIFLLFTESGSQQAIHTHDYRAYQYRFKSEGGSSFEPRTINIVNIGPAFRTQYETFRPVAPLPLLSIAPSYGSQVADVADSWSSSTESRRNRKDMQEGGRSSTDLTKEQMLLSMYSEGYNAERLGSLIGADGMRRVTELEDLYGKMLSKLGNLAKQVCETSAALVEQEKLNAKLKAGFIGD